MEQFAAKSLAQGTLDSRGHIASHSRAGFYQLRQKHVSKLERGITNLQVLGLGLVMKATPTGG